MKPTILIVDDTDQIRATFGRTLRRAGYGVLQATNGIEGVAAIERHRPSLVLLDLMMPELDGFGLMDTLKGRGLLSATKILVISAASETDARVRALNSGALDYIEKTASIEEILARVRNLLALRTMEEALRTGYTMMTAALTAATHLIRGPLDHAAREADRTPRIHGIHDNLRMVSRLLEQFHRYIDLQQRKIVKTDENLRETIGEALVGCVETLRLPLTGPSYNNASECVPMDRPLIEEVLAILLNNAAKHAPDDTPVTLDVLQNARGIVIRIANRHAGLSPETVARLFTPFAEKTDGAERGFGLDLAIAHTIACKHGGDLSCTSEPNGRTVFDLFLPAGAA